MFNLNGLFICIVLIGLVNFASCKPTQSNQLVHAYDKVNDYLVKKLEGILSVDEAKTVLFGKLISEQKKSSLFKDESYIQALKNIVALIGLEKPFMCTDESLELLQINDEGTEGKARLAYNVQDARLLDKLLFLTFVDHADTCKDVYIKRFQRKWSSEKAAIFDIYPLLTQLIEKRMSSFQPEELKANSFYKNIIRSKELTQDELLIINAELVKRTRADVEGKVNKQPHSSCYYFIGKSCDTYRKALGEDLFAPAAFDAVITQPGPKTDAELEYYKAFAGFNLCEQIAKLQL